jgi:T5SS/PEP-CTERM-associated repeat protein
VNVGTQGKATLSISGGGQLFSEGGSIGNGGEGTVVISGSGSKWQLAAQGFSVGDSSKGTLTIQNGGALTLDTTVRVGFAAEGDGYLYLDDVGSQLVAIQVDVGVSGRGMFTIRNGANLSGVGVFLATSSNSEGTLVVDSANLANSSVSVGGFQGGTGTFKVQNGGHASADVHVRKGEVQVTSGGQLTTSQLVVATQDTESGQVIVQGAGSHLQANDEIALGTLGDAHLLVQDGGSLNAPSIRLRIGVHATSTGSIRVRTGGVITADEISMCEPPATLEVSGGGYLKANSTLVLGAGTLQLVDGRIDVGNVPPLLSQVNFVNVGVNGHFSAGGAVPNLHNYFGDVHVGGSPGTLNVAGTYLQDAGSATSFSIAGTQAGTEYSQLIVGGDWQLSGKLTFSFENAFEPQAGQTFDLVTVSGTSQLTNYQIEIKNLATGFQYSFDPIVGGYRLTALSNGDFEPALPGDFSGDGMVDAVDYVVWRDHLGTTFAQAD